MAPELGRFLSRDALGGLNRYSYSANNPVNYVDPTGLDEEGPTDHPNELLYQDMMARHQRAYAGDPRMSLWPVIGTIALTGAIGVGAAPEIAVGATLIRLGIGMRGYAGFSTAMGGLTVIGSAIAVPVPRPKPSNTGCAQTLRDHPSAPGYTGVINMRNRRIILMPSADIDPLPEGYVAQYGGHRDASAALGGQTKYHFGFSITNDNGVYTMGWRSGQLNFNLPSNAIPNWLRSPITRWVSEATGRPMK